MANRIVHFHNENSFREFQKEKQIEESSVKLVEKEKGKVVEIEQKIHKVQEEQKETQSLLHTELDELEKIRF